MEKNTIIRNGVTIERMRLMRMVGKIILVEKINSRTKDANESEMVTKIQKIIEEEVNCL